MLPLSVFSEKLQAAEKGRNASVKQKAYLAFAFNIPSLDGRRRQYHNTALKPS
jgi:hypothetical protein